MFSLITTSQIYAADLPVLNTWFALGSGCRAKSDLRGNVRMELVPSDPGRPDVYRAKFIFNGLELRGDSSAKETLQFAKECAVRLNINPPKGKKISELRAVTSIATSKDLGASLDISSELKLGAASLGVVRKTLASNARALPAEEIVDIESDHDSRNLMPDIACGQPKVIGFDYSWIAKRDRAQLSSLAVELGQDKSLIVEATLTSCEG